MNVLGISCFYHDAAAALVVDGALVACAEEERFSRVKHDHEFPQLAIDFCLRTAGLSIGDLDLVVFYEKPFWKLDRASMSRSPLLEGDAAELVAPRALTLTAIARLALCDVFIHGTGGGRYDRLVSLLARLRHETAVTVPAVGFSIWLDRVGDPA